MKVACLSGPAGSLKPSCFCCAPSPGSQSPCKSRQCRRLLCAECSEWAEWCRQEELGVMRTVWT